MKKVIERRGFFKEAFSFFRKKGIDFVGVAVSGRPGVGTESRLLRPPGAVEEALFVELCKGCGECLKACPYHSIKLTIEGTETPIIIPKESPCYLCEDFPCIKACQSGAMKPVAGKEKVRMGVAKIKKKDCPAWDGGSCQLCVIRCPLSGDAIYLNDFRPVIREDKCVGCGVCEQVCLTVNDRAPMKVIPIRSQNSEGNVGGHFI